MTKVLVHLYGPVLSNSGYGVAARQVADFLLADNRFVLFIENTQWGNCEFIHESTLLDKSALPKYYESMGLYQQNKNKTFDFSIYCTIPNEFARKGKVCIGMTAGIEVDRITREWIHKSNLMDMIVVPSEFSKSLFEKTAYTVRNNETGEVFEEKVEKPIHVIPHWVNKPSVIEDSSVVVETAKNLLFVGMWGSKGLIGEDRKNVGLLLKYFYETFHDDSDVGLILKTEIVLHSEEDFYYTKRKIEEIKSQYKDARCKVYLIHDSLTEAQMWALYHHKKITGFVSLSHGEGFGIPLLEATVAGLPVLATNWSGHLDFLKVKNGYLPISFEMKEVPECQVWKGVIDKGSMWAEVDGFDVKRRMKKFLSSPGDIKRQAAKYAQECLSSFSKESVLKKWNQFFELFIASSEQEHERRINETKNKQILDLSKTFGVVETDKEKVLYVMPMSFGDIVISTCIVDSLLTNRHADCDFYFATKPAFKEVLNGIVKKHKNVKVIDYNDSLMNAEVTRKIWDVVYVPGVNVQYVWSNWTLGNGKYALNLFQEFAKACNLAPSQITDYVLDIDFPDPQIPNVPYICLTAVSSRDSKTYSYWKDVVSNIKEMIPGCVVVQFGAKDETLIDGCTDFRGISWSESLSILSGAIMHLGPDTGMQHASAALRVPHVVLFGSTSPNQCAPQIIDPTLLQLIIEPEQIGCGKCYCYKDVCLNKRDNLNCLSQIAPDTVCEAVYHLLSERKNQIENPQTVNEVRDVYTSAVKLIKEASKNV